MCVPQSAAVQVSLHATAPGDATRAAVPQSYEIPGSVVLEFAHVRPVVQVRSALKAAVSCAFVESLATIARIMPEHASACVR